MDTHTTLRRAARIQYAVLRAPLHLLDEHVVQRHLDEHSPARRTFETVLDTLDHAVEALLRDPASERPNTAPESHADPAASEPVVEIKPPAADEDAEAEADEAQEVEQLTVELLEEEETETFAGELAEDDELRQVQAELQAKRLIEEQRER